MERSVEIIIKTSPVYGYNFARCGFELIKSIVLLGERDHCEKELCMEISFSPELFYPVHVELERLNTGVNTVELPEFETVSGALLGCEKNSVLIQCKVFAQGEEIGESTVSVPLYSYDSFCASDYPAVNCVFVTPESRSVAELKDRVIQISGGESFIGREAEVFADVYSVIKNKALTYSIHPFLPEKKHQQIRLPAKCLSSGSANSAQMAFLFASVLESLGFDPLLVFLQNTVLTGIMLKSFKREFCEIYSKQLLIDAVVENKLILCDVTGACYGADIPFALSLKNAVSALEQNELAVALDVGLARKKGIAPVSSELYESRDQMSYDILADDLSVEKKREGLCSAILESREAELLCDTGTVGSSLEGDIRSLKVGEALAGVADELCGECICSAAVEYLDPISKKKCLAPALLAPLEKLSDGVGIRLWVPNSLLLERLSLGGLSVSEVKRVFAEQGKDAYLQELEVAISMCDFASLDKTALFITELPWKSCIYFDSCRDIKLPTEQDEVKEGFCADSFDKEFYLAMESALTKPVTRVYSEDANVKDEFIRALAANLLKENKRVLLITSRQKEIRELLHAEAVETKCGTDHSAYLEEVFSVGACGLSFDSALAGFEGYSNAPLEAPLGEYLFEGMDAEGVKTWSEAVSELVEAYDACGGVRDNPLRWIKNPAFSNELKLRVKDLLFETAESLDAYLEAADALFDFLQVERDSSYRNLSVLEELSRLLAEGNIPRGYFLYVNKEPDAVLKAGKMHRALCAEIEKSFDREVYKLDAGKLLEEINRNQCSVIFKRKQAVNAAVRELRGYALHPAGINAKNVTEICRSLIKCKEYSQYLQSNASYLNRVFSVDVLSPDAEREELWEQLETACARAKEYEKLYLSLEGADAKQLSAVLRLCGADERFLPLKNGYFSAKDAFYKSYRELCELLTLSDSDAELCQLKLRIGAMHDGVDGLYAWTRWLVKRDECSKLGLKCVCEQCESGEFDGESIRLNFVKGFFAALLRFIASKNKNVSPCDTAELIKRAENANTELRMARSAFLAELDLSKLSFSSVTDGHLLPDEEADVVILDCHRRFNVFEALPLLSKGKRAVVISSSFDDGGELSSGRELDRMGIRRHLLFSPRTEPFADEAVRRFSLDRGSDTAASPYPPLSVAPEVRICRVNGGYDDKSLTNVIEASVVCDMISDMVQNGVKSICVVTLGEEQKTLITAVLAKRLNLDPELKERFIGEVLEGFGVVTLKEGAFPCEQMIFATCFSCAEGGYAKGISPRIAEKLGEDPSRALAAILRADKKALTVTCAFSPEEIANTRMFIDSVESFKAFMTRIFFMNGAAYPHCFDGFDDPVTQSAYSYLCERGFVIYKNCGFSRIKTDMVLVDSEEPCRIAAVIISDRCLKRLGVDLKKAQLFISGLVREDVKLFYISDGAWFFNKQALLKELEDFCADALRKKDPESLQTPYDQI
ncbi:MAG: hypothetical protein E7646_06545 [Ruminococcaceae bacterium]|nr:hypothetical protein [Oscillospiraceae bacterium]